MVPIMKVFPCSVWCRYGDNAAIAFIIDSDNLSHCLACTCMFGSVSQIDSESVMTDIEFEESLRISEINITHSPYVFYSYNTFYPRPFPLFLTYYICPCLLTSLSMSTFIIFFPLLSVYIRLTPSSPAKQYEGSMCLWIMEEASFP